MTAATDSRAKMTALTDHQAKLFALELQRRHPFGDSARIGSALLDAQVDLNPHQVDAALFAFRSPFSKGVILADEVGLGKTIEAGLILTQRWAERQRRVIVIVPASLRKQWVQELADKFFLPSVILETKSFNAAIKAGISNPFDRPADDPAVIVCSYQFAARKAAELSVVPWDLAILDEAHRLRNVYKPGAKTAAAIRTALSNAPKLLLTATPLQNSLMELYGLVSMIDEHHFGDAKSFQTQYSRLAQDGRFEDLKARLEPVCHRTLRRQVVEYVSYTNRVPITQEFWPSEAEQTLYDAVSDYLRRPELHALPNSQRVLMVLVMRKLLASSTFAIAGALDSLARKLQTVLRDDDRARATPTGEAQDVFEGDFESLAEDQEEWDASDAEPEEQPPVLAEPQRAAITAEIAELGTFRDLAVSITENAKGLALLTALKTGFAKAAALGAADKAVIFTESRRTQNYLVSLLSRSGYDNEIVLFNGTNNDPTSKAVYQDWKERHAGSDLITGSPTADMRAALVEQFRTKSKIMIATEAAAEGINLQFCSLVVNYDLPWNPQRIEQRIGRCHRYGQKHDVVVINFLNTANAADLRVFELLDEKFRLFSGVFGASDELLGTIESGVDFERRIVDIYQNCRTTEAINEQFEQLRLDLDEQIVETMNSTRTKLLEHFDAEVHDRLRVSLAESTQFIDKATEQLWRVTTHVLRDDAEIDPTTRAFSLSAPPSFAAPDTAVGRYRLSRDDDGDAHRYRPHHPLALAVLDAAMKLETPFVELIFDYSAWPVRSEVVAPLVGSSGTIVAEHLRLDGVEAEDHVILVAMTDDGQSLTADQTRRLFDIPASTAPTTPSDLSPAVVDLAKRRVDELLGHISARQGAWFDDEMDKLDRWAEDKRASLKTTLREHDDALKSLKRDARQAASLPQKLSLQKKIKQVEAVREEAWRAYDAEARKVETAKEGLIDDVERRLDVDQALDRVFAVRFTVI
jgi:superfamily II DNA/RNA helicase